MGAGRHAGRIPAAALSREAALLRARRGCRAPPNGPDCELHLRFLPAGPQGAHHLRLAARRIYAAGDLLPDRAHQARVPGRGASRSDADAAAARPADHRHAFGKVSGDAMSLAIDVHDLVKRYGKRTVVDHVSLGIEQGRICGFLGPNGSGKTTTLRMICGLLTPDGGGGTCLGHDLVRERDAIKRQAGYMTQRFGLYEDLTIRENLEFVARVYGLDRQKERVDQSLERLGLATRQKQLAGALSGGWKQRLALAACVLHEPKLLLLDEPTAGVDPKARRAFWDEIHSYAAEGITVLVSTHYMDEAERCHEIAYIAYGELMARGSTAEIVQQSGLSAFVASGPGADRLAVRLRDAPGVTAAAAFGTTLHVCGPDREALLKAIEPYRADAAIKWEEAEPTLEDIFIHLMGKARDNALDA